ncbi:MAG: integrase family protein [Pseudomonadota bacterium]
MLIYQLNQRVMKICIAIDVDLHCIKYPKFAYTDTYMARVTLTPSRIADYRCESGKTQSFLWDSKSRCLALRATQSGTKAFVCQAKLHGKDIRMTLGSSADWTILDAREAANRFKVMVDQGVDPREVAAEAKVASQTADYEKEARRVIARTAWDEYLQSPHPKWGATHRRDHHIASQAGGQVPKRGKALTKAGPLAGLLAYPLHEINSDAVAGWLKKESASRPTTAGNSLRKFRAFINWCAIHPIYKRVTHTDCATAKLVTDGAPSKNTKEEDSLQKEQLKPWFESIVALENSVFSVYFQGLLLTGARRTEWQILKWSDVDFASKKMTIRDKVAGQRSIPLTPYLASQLKVLPRRNSYVFSSPSSEGGYVIGVSKPHKEALAKAGLPHVSLHGLRRSFSTLSEWLEVPVGVVAQIQGHKPSAIAEKHYKRRPIDLLRMHHEKLESWMLSQAGVIAFKPTQSQLI